MLMLLSVIGSVLLCSFGWELRRRELFADSAEVWDSDAVAMSLIPPGVLPNVKSICAEVVEATEPAVKNVWGYAKDPDHNNRRCVDYMVWDKAGGDQVAKYHLDNRYRLQVDLLIWNRRIIRSYAKPGIPAWTWAPYHGASTHTDHNHVQYKQGAYVPPKSQPVAPSGDIVATTLQPGDFARVTAKSGLWARTKPNGPRVKVRPYGYDFRVTDIDQGFAKASSYWYSLEFLAERVKVERIAFRGRLVCICVATSLPYVEQAMIKAGIIKHSIDLWQGGYNKGGVKASAGTHDRGGNIDVGQYSYAALKIWREWGWPMQARTRAQGFSPHGHGWPKGCTHLSAGGAYQASEWQNGRNGLRSRAAITGPGPKGRDTPTWTQALKAHRQ